MELSNQNILFLTRTMDLGGTENVILQLCEIFKPRVNKIVVCSCGGINVEKIEQIGIEHYNIPDIAKKSPTSVLNVIKTVKKIIKEEQITVIHSHHRMAAMYAQILSRHDMIKIANAHNTFLDKRFLTKFAYRNTNIVAVGEMVKKNLTDDVGIDSSQISVIHNSVNCKTEINYNKRNRKNGNRRNNILCFCLIVKKEVFKKKEHYYKATEKIRQQTGIDISFVKSLHSSVPQLLSQDCAQDRQSYGLPQRS